MFKSASHPVLFALAISMASQCYATDTLDCTGSPYSVMIHVGFTESGEDFLADVMLYKDGHSEAVAIYYNKDINITSFSWTGETFGNMINMSTKSTHNSPFSLIASQHQGRIIVNNKEFHIACYWELP